MVTNTNDVEVEVCDHSNSTRAILFYHQRKPILLYLLELVRRLHSFEAPNHQHCARKMMFRCIALLLWCQGILALQPNEDSELRRRLMGTSRIRKGVPNYGGVHSLQKPKYGKTKKVYPRPTKGNNRWGYTNYHRSYTKGMDKPMGMMMGMKSKKKWKSWTDANRSEVCDAPDYIVFYGF